MNIADVSIWLRSGGRRWVDVELTAVEAVEEARNARGRARALASSLNETCSALEWFVSFALSSRAGTRA